MADMGRCKDCRWWEDLEGDPVLRAEAVTRGESAFCQKIAVQAIPGYGARDGAHIVAIYDPDGDKQQLTDEDSEFCDISLLTGPDFGCVQWEAKADG